MRTLAPLLVLIPASLAACAVGRRLARTGALGALDRGLILLAVLVIPPHVLGWSGAFRAGPLLGSVWALAGLLSLACVWRSGSPRREVAAILRDVGAHAVAPLRALRRAWTERDLVGTLAWTFVLLLAAFALVLTWARPSTSWDGLWYHDPITCFAIQNGGYDWVDLPLDPLQVINGYPRLVEGMAGLFVALGDLRWIELPGVVSFPILIAALTVLAGHAGVRRPLTFPLAVLLATVPGLALELGSTYIDITTSALMLAAIALIGRPQVKLPDVWMAGLATAMLCGAKSTAVVIAPWLLAIGLTLVPRLRARSQGRFPRLRVAAPFVTAALLAVAFAAPLYFRNFARTGNPMWPLSLEAAHLGVEFDGPIDVVVAWPPTAIWLKETFGWPMQGMYFPDVRPHGYGHALPFLLPVLTLAALPGLARRLRDGHVLRLLAAAVGIALLTREVMWWGRFGMVPVATFTCVVLGSLARTPHRVWQRRMVAAALLIHAATLIGAEPGFERNPIELAQLAMRSEGRRAAAVEGALFRDEHVFELREAEFGPDDVVVFGRNVSFLGALWNRDVENRVVFRARLGTRALDETRATYAATFGGSPAPGWTRVGAFTRTMALFTRGSEAAGEAADRTPAAPRRAPPTRPPD